MLHRRSLIVVLALAAAAPCAERKGNRVVYVGGTLPSLTPKTDATLHTTFDGAAFLQTSKLTIQVPYENINLLEYGQKASRRLALAIVISPMFLLSKKRNHFLTLGFTDERGRQQAIVLQLDKDDVRAILASLEARTGRKVESQDDEARKGGR